MEAEINNEKEFQLVFSEDPQSDSTILCHLPPEISALDVEIRWFKETDCVCFYKNRRLIKGKSYEGISLGIEELKRGIVFLQLDIRESCVGDYLCQVTSGERTAEITISKSLKTHEYHNEMPQPTTTLWTKQTEKVWSDKERIKMANSALLAVFNSLEKTDPPKEDLEGINPTVLQTDINTEENQDETEEVDTQQDHTSRHMNESMSFPVKQETHPVEQQPGCSDVKVCIFKTGKTNGSDEKFTDKLQSRIENLKEVSTVGQSNIILVYCPAVSQVETDIDKALERFNGKTETKVGVLVVLHHTTDREKVIPDSSKYVNRTDILTVDCLFSEDEGLLECQKNSDAVDKVENWLIQQGRQTGVNIRPRQNFTNQGQIQERERSKKRLKMGNNEPSTKKVKVFSILDGKINNCHKEFFAILRNQIENLKEGRTVDESDIILVFCPIVSRAGTNIEAALNNFIEPTDSKLNVLVVLHHTFDPEKIVPDSSRCVSRTDILTVDLLFYEDTGLLRCQKNSDSADKTVKWLIQQGAKIGITISPCQHKSSIWSNILSWTQFK